MMHSLSTSLLILPNLASAPTLLVGLKSVKSHCFIQVRQLHASDKNPTSSLGELLTIIKKRTAGRRYTYNSVLSSGLYSCYCLAPIWKTPTQAVLMRQLAGDSALSASSCSSRCRKEVEYAFLHDDIFLATVL